MTSATMLELSDGTVALIDGEDVGRVACYDWRLPSTGAARYPVGEQSGDAGRRLSVYLHRLIANAGPDDIVVHRNHNTLDNRRENLMVMGRVSLPTHVPASTYEVMAAD